MSLRITIDLLPGGNETIPERLAMVEIANTTNLEAVSDYRVTVFHKKSTHGRAFFLRHERRLGFWPLVQRALGQAGL